MNRLWMVVLAATLVPVSLAQSPAQRHFIEVVKQLEAAIPGYSSTYYDKESGVVVVRIVPRLNPYLKRTLGERVDALSVDHELQLPRSLARQYAQVVRQVRLPSHLGKKPIRFAVGKYTWAQHYKWREKIYKFMGNPNSMAEYGYPDWPRNCIQSSFMRDVKEDKSYAFVLKSKCDEKFFQSFLQAIHEQLGIPTDAIGFLWLDEPFRLLYKRSQH